MSLLWGVLAVSRSPSACMGILSQTRAKGPVATFSLAFIMLSDVVVVILLATMLMLARPLITASGGISLEDFTVLGHEILGSIAVGVTLGFGLAIYLRLVGRQLLLVLLAIGFGLSDTFAYIHVDSLLAFLTAGFVVTNLSDQGPKLLHSIEQTGSVVFVVFFATAGAHLDIPLLTQLWPVAVALCASRALFTVVAGRIAAAWRMIRRSCKRWGWSSLVSQAGLALGLVGGDRQSLSRLRRWLPLAGDRRRRDQRDDWPDPVQVRARPRRGDRPPRAGSSSQPCPRSPPQVK